MLEINTKMLLKIKRSKVLLQLKEVPIYPNFKAITLKENRIISKYISFFPLYSDFSFINIYGWDINKPSYYCFINNNLLLKTNNGKSINKNIYTLLGNNEIDNTVGIILQKIPQLDNVPQLCIDNIKDKTRFAIEEKPNSFDYVYDLSKIHTLEGKYYKTKRRVIQKVKLLYPNLKTVIIDINNSKTQSLINMFLKNITKNKRYKAVQSELCAISRILEASSTFKVLTVGLFDKDKLIGFTINDISNTDIVFSPFLKVNQNYKGISDFITNETDKILYNRGFKYINTGEDLGIEGLRFYKNSWHPSHKLKKYSIKLI